MLGDTARLITEGLGALTAAGLAAGGWTYAARWPTSQLFGPTLVEPEHPRELALTFDDGPNPAWTPRLIEMLAAHRIKATFFLIGRFAEAEPYLTRHIADSGHVIGNHSWSHPNLSLTPTARVYDELSRTKHVLEQITGSAVRYFRPPHGARRPVVLQIARDLGMNTVMWNVMTNDWEEPSADLITQRITEKVDALGRRGRSATIVLHDGSHHALGADRGPSITTAENIIRHYTGVRRFVTPDYLKWG